MARLLLSSRQAGHPFRDERISDEGGATEGSRRVRCLTLPPRDIRSSQCSSSPTKPAERGS
jgi:hypothetical protein